METTENRIPKSTRQNPLTFYLRTLLYMVMALVMRVVAFAPLGALWIFPEGSHWRWLALLCPLLLIFFILPLRFSFAQALVQPARERRFSFDKATSVANYGSKLGQALVHALNIIKWGIPLWLMLGAGYYFYNKTDAITLMKGVGDVGAAVVTVLFAVANFFIGIAGGTALVPNGGIMEGLYTIGAVLGIGVLILLWGVMRNSAFRYIWALALQTNQNPRAEARRRLTGRRGVQFWVAMVNLILWVPALFVLFTTLKGMLSGLSDTLFNYVATKQLNLPELSNSLTPLIFAFAVCYLPLLPVRRILTAFFATKRLRHNFEEQTAPVETPAAPLEPVNATQTPVAQAPVFAPVFTPIAQNTEPEEQTEANEPAPVPAYTPYTQPAAEPEPAVKAYAAEAEPVKAAEPAYQSYHAYEPEAAIVETAPEPIAAVEPVAEPEPTYHPYQPEEAAVETVPEPVAQAEPAADTEPVYQPYQPQETVDAPVETVTEAASVQEPQNVYTAPLFTQPESPAEEDDYIKPYAPQLFDTSDTADTDAPADEKETDQ